MATEFSRRFDPRASLTPAAVALLVGLVAHAVDQALFVRAGPVPALVTAPVVATLLYLHLRDATRWQTLLLLAWGAVGSGLGILGVYLVAVGYELPRVLTPVEMVLWDFGLFLWFVLVLGVTYVVTARRRGWTTVATLLLAPVVQATYALFLVALVVTGVCA